MSFRKLLFAAAALAWLPVAGAAGTNAQDPVRAALAEVAPKAPIDAVEVAPLPGYHQAIVAGHVVYVSDDGKYLFDATLYDAKSQRNLSESRLASERRVKLADVPASEHVVFGPPNPKYKVTVFTDLDCGYCRKLHSQIAEYNALGIEFDYLFFPRTGVGSPSYDKAVSVWCAKDRKAAFTAAKAGKNPAKATCPNPVADEYKLGRLVGVDGTPAIYSADGVKIGGYLPPADMLRQLQAQAKPGSGTAG